MTSSQLKSAFLLFCGLFFTLSALPEATAAGNKFLGTPWLDQQQGAQPDKRGRDAQEPAPPQGTKPQDERGDKRLHRPKPRPADSNRRPGRNEPGQRREERPRPVYRPNKDNRVIRIQQPAPRVIPNRDAPRPPAQRHDHRHPRYWEGPRHRYDYVGTPWYFTRYLAPIRHPYYRPGHVINVMPRSYVRIVVGGLPYFYYSGIFYRPYSSGYIVVNAPIGAVVRTLPVGFIAFTLGLTTYYTLNDVYYVWDDVRDGYVVVEKPPGADQAMAEATIGRLFIYPNQGQDEQQQAKDRYECHRWAVSQSNVDPTLEDAEVTNEQSEDYRRAISACLEGRGYTVK